MPTISVPLSATAEAFIKDQIKRGRAANKADVVRRALQLLAEEEAVAAVLQGEKEAREGKLLKGDLKTLARKVSQ